MGRSLIISGIFLFFFGQVHAQESNRRCRWMSVFNQPISLDTLSVIPHSAVVQHRDSAAFEVHYDINTGKLMVETRIEVDSVLICYRVFPFNFNKRYYRRSLAVYDSNAFFKDPVKVKDPLLQREELFAIEGLSKSGNISRGISFGNNQDAFVNSALNLNMEGKLADNLNIRAVITDQRIPFQPEGNTRQLRDFDNVYIQVFNDNFSLTGGDVVLKSRPSYFLKYHKNVQGGLAEIKYNITDSITAVSSFGMSVAKGQFASVKIQPLEGVSGPYRIPGPENERFIIILAGSEKVFLDGELLTRGFNNDYTIDYNSAEITFTNQILITQFSRIRVDYEYSDRNYNRTIAVASHYQDMGRVELFVNAYSEKDSRNKPLLTELTNEDKLLLSSIGDDVDQAVISGADSIGYNTGLILYKKVDVVDADGGRHTIFKYSNDPDSAVYNVTFSNVGPGNGNYVKAQPLANGTVFDWVSPRNGVPQGQYEPVIRLPAPDKKQLVNMGGSFKINPYEKVYAELAVSDRDVNLFSKSDNYDDKGYAVKGGIISEGRTLEYLPEYQWKIFADFEFNDRYFNPIDRFRYIEFDRDWGYDETVSQQKVDDKIFNAGLGVRKDEDNGLNYKMSYRKRGYRINGFQHRVNLQKSLGKFRLRASFFDLQNDRDTVTASWVRYMADLSYHSEWLVPGYIYRVDKNRVALRGSDAVISSALYFDEHAFYLQSGKKSPVDFELRHSRREDMTPHEGRLVDFTNSKTTRFTLNKDFKRQQVKLIFTHRGLHNLQLDKNEESLSGRLDWQSNWLGKHIRSDLTYAISNSRELKREYVFMNVPTGQGTHTWRDLNADGLQGLNEFFEALNPDERNYAKIFVPTGEFVTAFQNLFLYRITIDMPKSWRDKGWLRKFLSRFSNNTSWSADVKTTDTALESRLLGFAKDIEKDLLLSQKNVLRSTWFYNRASPDYGAEIGYHRADWKQLLSGGFDARNTEAYTCSFRLNLSRRYSVNLRSSRETKTVHSDFLPGRNYRIGSHRVNPELAWQPTANFRLSGQYVYEQKQNILTPESGENALFNEFIMDLKLTKAIKSTFNARLRWVEIAFTGKENSPVGYDLLNALRPGTNITWGINWQQKIASGLQLSLSYDGRKSEGNDPIHIGRVQVSALF